MDVGKRIKKLRESLGMEQLELAHKIKISQSKMNKIETGFQKRIEPDILVDLANVLNATVDYIVGKSSDPSLTEDDIDAEIKEITDKMNVWYKSEPEDKELKLRMLRRMIESFEEDE